MAGQLVVRRSGPSGIGRFVTLVILLLSGCAGACKADDRCDRTLKVAVDIGHSAQNSGAISARGKSEFVFNERFAKELVAASASAPDLELFLINPDGMDLSLSARPELAEKAGADIFVSIHHDSVNSRYYQTWRWRWRELVYSDAFRGYSLFVSKKSDHFERSHALARMIGKRFKEAALIHTLHHGEPIQGENRTILDWDLGVYDAPFAVLRLSKMPAVLIETGVLIHRDEELLLETDAHRALMASKILAGLRDFCRLAQTAPADANKNANERHSRAKTPAAD